MGYIFKKLADSWTALTDAEKKALFEGTNYLKPSVDEIKSLGDFKCLVYSDNSDAKFKLTGVPNDQLVLPSGLISMLSFDGINNISLANTVSTNGIIKMAVTLDKSIYYTYDSTNSKWNSISPTADDLLANGMAPTQIATVNRKAWDSLVGSSETIGFAYLLSESAETDVVKVDTLTMNVDMKGSWVKATHNTDYTYAYTTNRSLTVDLLTTGDFKINYPIGTSTTADAVASTDDIINMVNRS